MKHLQTFESKRNPTWLSSWEDVTFVDNSKSNGIPDHNARKPQDSDIDIKYNVFDLNVEQYIKEFSNFDLKYRKGKIKNYISLQIGWMCGQNGYNTGMCKNPYEWALFHWSLTPYTPGKPAFDSRQNLKP